MCCEANTWDCHCDAPRDQEKSKKVSIANAIESEYEP